MAGAADPGTTTTDPGPCAGSPPRGTILVVDDEEALLRAYRRMLRKVCYDVELAESSEKALALLQGREFDLIISDITMPGMDGLELLRRVRERDLDVPVVFVTGNPAVETAARAVEYGALRYLLKPVNPQQLEEVVEKATRLHRIAKIKRQAMSELGTDDLTIGDLAGLETSLQRAMSSLYMAYQPIVRWSEKNTFAFEALLRSNEAVLRTPNAVLSAAERLDKLHDVGRAVRGHVARALDSQIQVTMFVNLHAFDLLDDELYSTSSPLTKHAERVVLEVTERASLTKLKDIPERAAALRRLGYRIAVDDLGAGYAGLTSFAQLEPDVVKLDMSLVRDVHRQPTKAKLIRSMNVLCREMGLLVVAEGVESPEERNALIELGCDLLQGYLFARPHEVPPAPVW